MATDGKKPSIIGVKEKTDKMNGLFAMERFIETPPLTDEQQKAEKIRGEYEKKYNIR